MRSVEIGKRLRDSTRLGRRATQTADKKAKRSTKERDQKLSSKSFLNNLPAGRADCRVDGELSRARAAPRAANKLARLAQAISKTRPTASKEQAEIRSVFADEIIEQRSNDRCLSTVRIRIRFLQTRRDPFHFRPRLIDSHAGLELCPRHKSSGDASDPSTRGCCCAASSKARRRCLAARSLCGGMHTDNGETLVVQGDRATHHRRVCIECPSATDDR